jgi:hypothetical protein
LTRTIYLALVVLSLSVGCTGRVPPEAPAPAVNAGKADSPGMKPYYRYLEDRLCDEVGQPPKCDICKVNNFYGDGKCDEFCPQPDPDCPPPDTSNGNYLCDPTGNCGYGQ